MGSHTHTLTLSSEASFIAAFILKRPVTDILTFSTLQHKFEHHLKIISDVFYHVGWSGIAAFFPLFK